MSTPDRQSTIAGAVIRAVFRPHLEHSLSPTTHRMPAPTGRFFSVAGIAPKASIFAEILIFTAQ